jgi:putative hydrolase of the HAD superfamily
LVELVCFDLGGVLVRTRASWGAACSAAGVPLTPEARDEAFAARLSAVLQRATVGELDAAGMLAEVGAVAGITAAQAAAVSRAWLLGPYAGVEALLAGLAGGVRLACLSNTNAHHWEILQGAGGEVYGWMSRFDYRFASHVIGLAKPDEAVFAHVERATGIEASRILFFDDLAAHCEAARQRGWRAHVIDPAGETVATLRALLSHVGVRVAG